MRNEIDPSYVSNITSDLKRGLISVAVLSKLKKEKYGYVLQKELSEAGLEVEQGTLYPLLRRMEAQGFLKSDWRIEEDTKPRRYYITSPEGEEALTDLIAEWDSLVKTMDGIIH